MRVGYVLGTYPRASDTFVQREVAGVRAAGVQVDTISVRRPAPGDLVGPEQVAEHDRTTYVLPASARAVAAAQAGFVRRHPRRWREAVRLAAASRPPGLRATALQAAYLAEAAVVAQAATDAGISHLHNHFGDQSATVTMLAARLADVPFSMTVHGPHIFFEPDRAALGLKASQAAFVACISDFCRSQVMLFAPRASWSRMHIVHCGVVPELFEEPQPGPAGRFRVLTVCRLAAEKGLPVLFAAARRAALPGLELCLVGDGPDRASLEALASDWGLDVEFAGNRSQAEVRDLLRGADVLASVGFAEGIPTALMEGMAARLPVVATRIAGVPELVDERCGRLVPPGNPARLAAALAEIHRLTTEQRRALGEAGRRIVSASFDASQEAAKLAALFGSSSEPAGLRLDSDDLGDLTSGRTAHQTTRESRDD